MKNIARYVAHQIEAPAGQVPQSPGREIDRESHQTNPLNDTMSSEIQAILFPVENYRACPPRSLHVRHFQNTSQRTLLLTPDPFQIELKLQNQWSARLRFPRPDRR